MASFRALLSTAVLVAAQARAQTTPYLLAKELIPSPTTLVAQPIDFDADGDMDLLTENSGILVNDGHGSFTRQVTPAPLLGLSAATAGYFIRPDDPLTVAGDMNGDGFPDVLSINQTSYASLALATLRVNNLAGSFTTATTGLPQFPPGIVTAIAAGDVDGDGDLDIVFGFENPPFSLSNGTPSPSTPRLWRNDGSGGFTDVTGLFPANTACFASQILLADVDGDGDLDVFAAAHAAGSLGFLLRNDGVNGFTLAATVGLGFSLGQHLAIGDVDGDGRPDVIDVPEGLAQVSVLLNAGASTFAAPVVGPIPSPGVPALVDVDGDGRPELIVRSALAITVHPISTSGVVGAAIQTVLVAAPKPATQDFLELRLLRVDVDVDGDQDVVARYGGGHLVLFNDSQGHLVPAPGTLMGSQDHGGAQRGPEW